MFRFTQDDFSPLLWCPDVGQPVAVIIGDYMRVPKYITCGGNVLGQEEDGGMKGLCKVRSISLE